MQTLLKILKNIIKGIFYIAVFLGFFILAVRFESRLEIKVGLL